MSCIYIDNNASTPLDPAVIEEMTKALRFEFANPASKTHPYGWRAKALVDLAREQVANLINAKAEEIIFTSGATESINLALKGLSKKQATKNQIISAKTEHSASLDSLQYLKHYGLETQFLAVDTEGKVTEEELARSISPETFLINLMLANNEIGTLHEIKKLRQIAETGSCLFHCDATQAIGKMRVDVKDLGIELMSFSAHKIYGPKGIGALYLKSPVTASKLVPEIHGGGHEQGLRSGTLNLPAIVGFGKACEVLKERLEQDIEYLKNLSNIFFATLGQQVGNRLRLNGPKLGERLAGNVNLRIKGLSAANLVRDCSHKLAFSLGSACGSNNNKNSHVLEAIGLSKEEQNESIRISFGRFNSEEEARTAAAIIASASK